MRKTNELAELHQGGAQRNARGEHLIQTINNRPQEVRRGLARPANDSCQPTKKDGRARPKTEKDRSEMTVLRQISLEKAKIRIRRTLSSQDCSTTSKRRLKRSMSEWARAIPVRSRTRYLQKHTPHQYHPQSTSSLLPPFFRVQWKNLLNALSRLPFVHPLTASTRDLRKSRPAKHQNPITPLRSFGRKGTRFKTIRTPVVPQRHPYDTQLLAIQIQRAEPPDMQKRKVDVYRA